ncbi:hypothetical protein M408DRAFT_151787 [Serendipita vermifera MAFF 305830]|uniref:Ribonuclease P protein subunit n=1 Tax=Serendipita vermifera MAFF 305830 TaxID=933852 RepID=A0A0C2X567_SERVB|nr:hypothetical protein M408DRAFT_151787 [Serendipita vermifera MAFF 305830]
MDPYQPLPPIKGQRFKFSSATPFTPTLLRSQLPPSVAATYETRLENQQVQLTNPPKESADKALRLAKKQRRKAAQDRKRECVMGKRKAMELGVWKFDERLAKWEIFWPVHAMWTSYIAEALGLAPRPEVLPTKEQIGNVMPSTAGLQAKLIKADLHGCIVKVKECKNASRVGREGIVVHETSNTFKIVTKEDKLKVLPKQGAIFTLSLPLFAPSPHSQDSDPRIEFELYGNQFRFRAAERASKKFKPKETIEL